jgi:hypothetical protein
VPTTSAQGVQPVGLRPGRLDLRVVRGDDFRIRLEFFNADDDPIDISGWTLGAQIRTTYQGSLLASFTVETATLPDNELNLEVAATVTATIGEGVYPWDLQRFAGTSLARTLLSGVVVVSPDVTEAP